MNAILLWAAVAAALTPGVVALVTGRRMLRHTDDPALPELLQARRGTLTKVSAAAIAVIVVFGGGHGWWAMPLSLVGLLAGDFPLRRSLWQESWSLAGYVWANVRGVAAFVGPWLLAALTPALVLSVAVLGERAAWVVAAACMLAILAWQHWYRQVWLGLMRAEPIDDPVLLDRFAEVAKRSRVAMPDAFRFGDPASSLMNAVAIPHVRQPAVGFTRVLLRELGPDEIVAVFGHELAHLEHYDRRHMARLRLVGIAIALLSAALPLVMMTRAPWLSAWLGWLWIIALLITFGRRAAVSRKHETESDVRAVALTGDAEALVRALTALHVHARMPRRWAHDEERVSTHPSLANRIRDIRAAASADAAPAEAPLAAPVVIRGAEPGTWVAFDARRAHWGTGAPDDAVLELPALRDRSSSYRAAAYDDLAELRVEVRGDRRLLRATDRSGAAWTIALAPADVAPVQQVLDLVDVRFGARAPSATPPVLEQLAATALLLALLVAGQFGAVLIPVAIAAFRVSRLTLLVAGLMAVAPVLTTAGDPLPLWAGSYAGAALVVAGMLGATLVWLAWRRRGEGVGGESRVVLAALAITVFFQLGTLLADGDFVPSIALPGLAALGITAVGLGAALAVAPPRRRRAGTVIASLGAIAAAGATIVDRVAPGTPEVEWERAVATVDARVAIGGSAARLRASPGGHRFAVARWTHDEDDYAADLDDGEPARGPMEFLLGDFEGGRRTVRARDLAFVDDDRILAVARRDSVLELRLERAESGETIRLDTLPSVLAPTLTADASSGTWIVMGRDRATGALVRVDGRVGARETRTRRWPAETSNWFVPMLFDGGASFVVARNPDPPRIALPFAGAAVYRHDLVRRDETGHESFAARLTGFPMCIQSRPDADGFCLANEGRRSTLWRVSGAEVERVAQLAEPAGNPALYEGRWLATTWRDAGFVVLDVSQRRGLRITVPDSGRATDAIETASGIVALSHTYGDARASTSVVRYTVASPTGRIASPAKRASSRPPRG